MAGFGLDGGFDLLFWGENCCAVLRAVALCCAGRVKAGRAELMAWARAAFATFAGWVLDIWPPIVSNWGVFAAAPFVLVSDANSRTCYA
jgi:hypothetical protein